MPQPRYYPQLIASPQPQQYVQRREPGPANEAVQSVYARSSPLTDVAAFTVPAQGAVQGTAVKMPKREAWGKFLAYEVHLSISLSFS